MSDLIVIGLPKMEGAEQVRPELVTIQQQHLRMSVFWNMVRMAMFI